MINNPRDHQITAMSTSPFLLLPRELRDQIIAYIVPEDLIHLSARKLYSFSDTHYRNAPLLSVNRQTRIEYLDALTSDPSIVFYAYYRDTAMWEIVHDKSSKVQTYLGSSFKDFSHISTLASAQRDCEHCEVVFGRPTRGRMCGVLSVTDIRGSVVQRFWRWDGLSA